MTLIYDDFNEYWVWVEMKNHDIELSPQFDYEDDAIQWKERLASLLRVKNEN